MEAILKKVIELESLLQKAVEREDARAAKNSSKADELSARETIVSEKESDLSAREKAVSKIEDIVKLKDDALAARKEAEDLGLKNRIQKDDQARSHAEAMAEVAAKKNDLIAREARLKEDQKLLDRSWTDLRKKESTYREEVLQGIWKGSK